MTTPTDPTRWVPPGTAAAAPLAPADDPYGAVSAPAPAPGRPTEPLATLALVLGILAIVPLAVIVGFVALRRVRRNGKAGRATAWAGIVVSIAWVVLAGIVALALAVASLIPPGTFSGDGPPADGAETRVVGVDQVKVGDCTLDFSYDENGDFIDEVFDVRVVPCTQPHDYEVTVLYDVPDTDVPDGEYPGDREMVELAYETCFDLTEERFADIGAAFGPYDVEVLHPTRDTWSFGDRGVICLAYRYDGQSSSPIGPEAGAPGPSGGPQVQAGDLKVGDCALEFLFDSDEEPLPAPGGVTVVACDQPHEYETVATYEYDTGTSEDSPYPAAEIPVRSYRQCLDHLLESLASHTVDDTRYDVFNLYPEAAAWRDGDRRVICLAYRIDGEVNDTPLAEGPTGRRDS